MRQILGYIIQMVPLALMAGTIFGVVRPLWYRRLEAKGSISPPWRECGLLFFVMFLAGLAMLTLLPRIAWQEGRPVFLLAPGNGGINLTPGRSLPMLRSFWRTGNLTAFSVNLFGNIFMFAPIGFFIALLWDKPRWWKSTLITCVISLFVEFCQLFLARGTDIDDLLLNTFGGLLGYGCFWLLRYVAPHFTAKFSIEKAGTTHGHEAGN